MTTRLVGHTRQIDVQVDESAWITSGFVTFRLFTDFAPPSRWEDAYRELGSWGNMNPPVGKFLIGLFTAAVIETGDSVAYMWDWTQTAQWNRERGHMPPPHVLIGVRRGMVLLGAMCLLLTYLIAVQLVGVRWTAIWAPMALFFNPVFREQSATVYTGIPQLLFLLLACWWCNRFLVYRSWTSLLASGVALGLACAVKFNSAPLVLVTALLAWSAWPTLRRRIVAALGIGAIALGTFVAVNPYLYPGPAKRTLSLIREWSRGLEQQQADSQLVGSAVTERTTAVSLVLKRAIISQDRVYTGLSGPPTILEVFAAGVLLLALFHAIARNELRRHSSLAVLTAAICCGIAYWLWYRSLGGAALLLLLAGLSSAWRTAVGHRWANPTVFLAVAFVAFAVAIALWLPFDWARYYLTVSVWIPLLQVVGLETLVSAGTARAAGTAFSG